MAHIFDSKTSVMGSQSNPITMSHTCGTGTTLLILAMGCDIVGYQMSTSQRGGGAPTYNNVAMTQISPNRQATETYVEMWYLVNPSIGTYTFSLPNTNSPYTNMCYVMLSSYIAAPGYTSDFDVSTGYGTTSSTSNPSLTVITTVNGDVLVMLLGSGRATGPSAWTHTLINTANTGSRSVSSQYALQTTAESITLGWTVGADDHCEMLGAWKEVVLPPSGYTHTVNGIAAASIASINGVATANIAKVNGV